MTRCCYGVTLPCCQVDSIVLCLFIIVRVVFVINVYHIRRRVRCGEVLNSK